jgi:hypothetical protein
MSTILLPRAQLCIRYSSSCGETVYTRDFVAPYDLLQSDEAVAAHECGGERLDQPAGCPDTV